MVHESSVHNLCPLELLQLLDEAVVAKDGSGEAEGVGRRGRHALDHLVLELLEQDVDGLPGLGIRGQLLVPDHHIHLQ